MTSTSQKAQQAVAHACHSCDKPDNLEMAQCDIYDTWFHFTCVGVTEDISNSDWACSTEASSAQIKEGLIHQKWLFNFVSTKTSIRNAEVRRRVISHKLRITQ